MNRDSNRADPRAPHAADPSPHTLIAVEPRARRSRAPLFYLGALALVLGVAAGVVWLAQSDLGAVETLPEQATTPLPTATLAEPPAASVPTAEAEVAAQADTSAGTSRPALAPAAAPTIAPTATPIPYLDSIEGVIGLGGADVWNEDGRFAGRLAQGALLAVQERSADSAWLYVVAESGLAGWTATDAVIVFDSSRLRPRDLVLIPITPTPVMPDAAAVAGSPALLPTPTSSGAQTGQEQQPQERLLGRVTLESGRLNVRSGPSATYPVIAKALPGEAYFLLGRSADAVWLQIELLEPSGEFGWVAAEYITADASPDSLPVASDVSDAPPVEAAERAPLPAATTAPEQSGDFEALPAPAPPLRLRPAPAGQPSGQGSATGLSGTLVLQTSWGGDISLYDLESGELRLLTGGFDPSLSPDGSKVAFTRDGGENGVYVIDIATGEERLIFGGRELLRSPKWSPDGRWIVFVRGDEYILCKNVPARCGLSVESPDGDLPEKERQPALARVSADGGEYQDLPVLQYAGAPDWTADGIVYQSLGGLQITQDAPGADTQLVYFDIQKQYELDPDWQPRSDGSGGIVFHRREASHWEIFTVNPDGSGLRGLTQPPFALAESFPSNVSPAFSPDGEHIVFLSNRTPQHTAGEWRVWVMDKDGGNQRPLPIDLPFVYTYVSEQMLDWGP